MLLLALFMMNNASIAEQTASKHKPSLRQLKWLGDNTDKVLALSTQPSECLNPDAPGLAALGRLAFQSPALLGGQAARMGLSCESCHTSARGNTDFFLENISSHPGTADVTHSLFSSTAGNQTFTPTPIPDLADRQQSKIQDRSSNEFRLKIKQLIEVEFDGQQALPSIMEAIQIYLVNIDSQFCASPESRHKVHLANDWNRLIETVEYIGNARETELSEFLSRVARQRIESIYRRYLNIDNKQINQGLIDLSRQLQKISHYQIDDSTRITDLEKWHQNANKLHKQLRKFENLSAYNQATLTTMLKPSK